MKMPERALEALEKYAKANFEFKQAMDRPEAPYKGLDRRIPTPLKNLV